MTKRKVISGRNLHTVYGAFVADLGKGWKVNKNYKKGEFLYLTHKDSSEKTTYMIRASWDNGNSGYPGEIEITKYTSPEKTDVYRLLLDNNELDCHWEKIKNGENNFDFVDYSLLIEDRDFLDTITTIDTGKSDDPIISDIIKCNHQASTVFSKPPRVYPHEIIHAFYVEKSIQRAIEKEIVKKVVNENVIVSNVEMDDVKITRDQST